MLLNSVMLLAFFGAMSDEAASKPVSQNARCGQKFGEATCQGSRWGNCCSQYGYCGSTKDYCEAKKCQNEFGTCSGQVALSSIGRTTLSTSIRTLSLAPTSSSGIPTSVAISSPASSSSSSDVSTSVSPSSLASSASPSICSALTITESASPITIFESASIVTVTQSALPALTETSRITLTETSTQTTSQTATVTEISSTTVSTTVSTTLTASGTPTQETPSCPTQAIKNPSFETGATWIYASNPVLNSGLIRGSPGSTNPAREGSYIVQSAIDRVLDVNSGHRITQAVRVCPGQQYRFSISLRTISASAASRPTLVQVLINGVRIVTSTAVTVDQGWVDFTGAWGADASTDAAVVQIVTYCESSVASGTWSYLWIDQATLSVV